MKAHRGVARHCGAILIGLALLAGCSRREERLPVVAENAAVTVPAPSRTRIAIESRDQARVGQTQPVAAARSPEFLAPRGERLQPEDFDIGPLQDQLDGVRDEIEAATVILRFLSGLSRQIIDPETVPKGRVAELQRTILPRIIQQPEIQGARVGDVAAGSGGAVANVRLESAVGWAAGEVYLVREGDSWLVDDLQVDLAGLSEPRTPREEKFLPNSYRWLLY